ncbi:hypothetical protein [Klebsiella aerogenes]|uniref:hypothetical protein n=1 Tax=Klebsiella aerogenes TaxID=548 RepID=UPI001BD08F6F|nr:hypothetical protein [Klebsiella aerogenes]
MKMLAKIAFDVTELHSQFNEKPGVGYIKLNDQTIGFLTIDELKMEASDKTACAIVLPDGSELGHYDCPRCAMDALIQNYFGLPAEIVSTSTAKNHMTEIHVIEILQGLKSQAEKRPH